MNARRKLLKAIGAGALSMPSSPFAQVTPTVRQVGFLAADSASSKVYDSFRQGMRDLGYVENRNCVIRWRFAEGHYDRLATLAEELVRSKVEVIVAGTTLSVQAARKATSTIPIVMVAIPDPVGEGFVSSLPRPGGNVTGLSNVVTEASAKHVELLRIVLPQLARIAVLSNPANPSGSLILEQVAGAAFSGNIKVLSVEASTPEQIDAAFAAMARARTEAVIVAADSYFDVQREQIARLAIRNRLPTIYSNRELPEAGGLMSYGQDLGDHYRRAASYVDKILKGAKPSDLPVEQPLVLELVINRRTAAALGLALPNELVLRADRMVD